MNRRSRLPVEPAEAFIDSLSHDGRGVAHIDGKAVFIDMALPGERVRFRYTSRQRRYDEGKTIDVLQHSSDRVAPQCAYYEMCGGCSLQHLSSAGQLRAKQQIFLEALQRIGKVQPVELLRPLQADIWGYRSKARLSVRYVPGKSRVLIGFREKRSSYITDMRSCETLLAAVGRKINALSELVESLSIKADIPQIEVAAGEKVICLIFRILQPLNEIDKEKLKCFGKVQNFQIMIQPGGPDTVFSLDSDFETLHYKIDENALELAFAPFDFTQVNQSINRKMVSLAMDLLAPAMNETVLDLFCGLGNFSLPLARRSKQVIGIEGDARMVARAYVNMEHNHLNNLEFFTCDLSTDISGESWMQRPYQKILLDPPRAGAEGLMMPIAKRLKPDKILYISCNPATLARDAGKLVQQYGYQMQQAGIMDMFPQTSHVECIALFVPR